MRILLLKPQRMITRLKNIGSFSKRLYFAAVIVYDDSAGMRWESNAIWHIGTMHGKVSKAARG